MPLNKGNLLELDVEKLFEERSIDYIIEIERLIDEEIERKRSELRLMVGDRYKDVLAASDAIKSMKKTSEDIVSNIDRISQSCEELITKPSNPVYKSEYTISKAKIDERTLLIQLRLTLFLNEQIWLMLDEENNLDAAQYYLLAQHIHTGFSLLKQEELKKILILNQIKNNLILLRSKIFEKITQKLESVETSSVETSKNLNALMLLENQTSIDLLNVFVEHRKTALQTVINMEYSNVRAQISSMVQCLLTTVALLHECFLEIKNGRRGLIWEHVKELSEESSSTTLSKLNLPITPLVLYIPEILKTFRPRYKTVPSETYINNVESVMKNWLETTHENLRTNLKQLLLLITNVRGLHLAKEESFKIQPPDNWEQICTASYFPKNFNIWYYFFQQLFTERCKTLISQNNSTINEEIRKYVITMLENVSSTENPELKLRSSIWKEEAKYIKTENNSHRDLSMKTKGFSEAIVDLCVAMDNKYVKLLEDVSQYLYGKEYNSDTNLSLAWKDFKFKQKHLDTLEIENHLRTEVTKTALELPHFVENLFQDEVDNIVTKSIICARFLQSTLQLCPHFNKCCSLNNPTEDWIKICDSFNKCSYGLWKNWLENVKKGTEKQCVDLSDLSSKRRIQMMVRWDEIEIQEQTEEKVFKSQIKIPLKASLGLSNILQYLNDRLSKILPFTLPKTVHVQFIEENVSIILNRYKTLLNESLNQKQAIQFLFDVRFLTTFCIPRENVQLISCSQEICDNLRSRIDPFDLDVFYSYIQNNVKRAVVQSQILFGCLLPSSTQLANLGMPVEKNKDLEKKPSILAISTPSTSAWFPLLPISLPILKSSSLSASKKSIKDNSQKLKTTQKKPQDPARLMKQSASSFFGGLNTDWFS